MLKFAMQPDFPSGESRRETAFEVAADEGDTPGGAGDSTSPVFDWLAYVAIVACSFTGALIGAYHVEADTVAYLDLSDAVMLHRWHSLVNASWFPLYPAVVAIGKTAFGNRLQYEFMAARLVDAVLGLFLVLASVVLARSIHHLMLARGVKAETLLPQRTLYLWVAIFAYFFVTQDLTGIKPDALLSSFLLLAVASLLWGIASGGLLPYIALGLCGALAYWTKAFAFPVFLLLIFLAAAVNLRRTRVLGRLLLALAIFVLVVGPYVWQMSLAKGRFTIGDSGSLNAAWYVNGADRFNPISNFTIYQRGTAKGAFKHPGELLATIPEITYYGGDQVFGTTPQWDDFSYWSSGLRSTFNLHQIAASSVGNLVGLCLTLPMRLQTLFLIAALCCWGFLIRKASVADPILIAIILLALASIGSLMLVHLESRYITFAFVLIGTSYAACSIVKRPSGDQRLLHTAVLLMAGLILLYGFQNTLRQYKLARQQGAHPMQGVYNARVYSAGADLAAMYPRGSEVACMGDEACWDDPYWARLAALKMTAIIETGNGYNAVPASQGCTKLQQNPGALVPLRQRHIRAIIAQFDAIPCSTEWEPLESSSHYYYLPL